MAEDWFADVRKYVPDADEGVVKKIVNYLGIALRNRDSSLVSFSDPEEVGRVKERFLRKKLALTEPDDVLDRALGAVRDVMQADRTKNRVTVYYLLADWLGKLDLFGGQASAPGGFSFGALGRAAAAAPVAAAAIAPEPEPIRAAEPIEPIRPVEPIAAVQSAYTEPPVEPTTPSYAADPDVGGDGGGGFPGWLKWLLLLAALVLLFLLLRSCLGGASHEQAAAPDNAAVAAGTETSATNDTATAETATVPTGAGVVPGEANGKPMLTVYFDSGKSEVSNDLAAQAVTLKAYLDANPTAKLAVSGYNDPTGNAAVNAELAKKRAQGVAAALAAAGIPEGSVELVKPADTTTTTVTPEQARRVEVTVQ